MNNKVNQVIKNWQSDFKGKHQNTYKFCLQLAILDNVNSLTDNTLSLDTIIKYFYKKYWDNVNLYNIRESNNLRQLPYYHKYVKGLCVEYSAQGLSFTKAIKLHSTLNSKLVNSPTSSTLSNPISRLQHDSGTQQANGSATGTGWLYEWDLIQQSLIFNDRVIDDIRAHKDILKQLTIYQWAKFIEKYNTLPSVINKLEEDRKRPPWRSEQKKFLKQVHNGLCFYCPTPIDMEGRDYEIDHFIPFAYIFGNPTWNLVTSCKACNRGISGKFEKVPTEKFLKKLIERNSKEFKFLESHHKEFQSQDDLKDFISKQYTSCINSGFKEWEK